ncbi:MAG: hypothetical protein ACP5G2_06810 [Candidatus Bipolaricaulaceae bacterium]
MKSSLAVALTVAALVLGFVGGIVGGMLFSGGDDTAALKDDVRDLETEISQLESQLAALPEGPGLKIGYVDAESLFIRVFLTQVESERQAMQRKQADIQSLQARYLQGEVTPDQYQQQVAKLRVELLQSQLAVDLSMLDKMIASAGFANFRSDLERIREQARPLEDQVKALLESVEVAVVDMETFLAQYQQLSASFQQLDQLLTQAAAAKIVEIAQQVGDEEDYDLVLRKKDVLIYRQEGAVSDISPSVEQRLWNLFPAQG